MRRLLLIALLASLALLAEAQRFGGGSRFGGGFGGRHYASRYAPQYTNSFPFLWDSLYAGDLYATDYSPPQPPIVVMPPIQAPARDVAPPEPESEAAEPLLIELQGNRYVQVSGDEDSTAQMLDRGESGSAAPNGTVQAEIPAVLVFRDGHREEVSSYTIIGDVLYTQSDYYLNRKWNEKIDLAALDLPETVSENQSRGIPFHLPHAANEVIVGP